MPGLVAPDAVAGQQPTFESTSHWRPTFHEAAKNGDLHSCHVYIMEGHPLEEQDAKGITPLGYAVGTDQSAVVRLLCESGADPHKVDASNNTGLHYAAGYGRLELVEYFLQVGVVANLTNANGQTPLAVASINKKTSVLSLLRAHGGHA